MRQSVKLGRFVGTQTRIPAFGGLCPIHWTTNRNLVVPGRVELPTSPFVAVRSVQLSYGTKLEIGWSGFSVLPFRKLSALKHSSPQYISRTTSHLLSISPAQLQQTVSLIILCHAAGSPPALLPTRHI